MHTTMSKLDKYDYEKLLDDIKLISRAVKIIECENDPDNKKRASNHVSDLLTRLFRDIKEMHEDIDKTKTYGGYLDDDGKEFDVE